MLCKTCQIEKPQTEFYKCSTCRSGVRSECKRCFLNKCASRQKNNPDKLRYISEWQKAHREKRNEAARRYGASIKGRVRKMYHAIKWRTQNVSSYKGVELKIGIEEFIEWATPEVERFLKENPNKTPSVDRKDPDGNYEFGNIRIIDLGDNIVRSRYLLKHLGLTPDSPHDEKLAGLKKIVAYVCENLGMPPAKILW